MRVGSLWRKLHPLLQRVLRADDDRLPRHSPRHAVEQGAERGGHDQVVMHQRAGLALARAIRHAPAHQLARAAEKLVTAVCELAEEKLRQGSSWVALLPAPAIHQGQEIPTE